MSAVADPVRPMASLPRGSGWTIGAVLAAAAGALGLLGLALCAVQLGRELAGGGPGRWWTPTLVAGALTLFAAGWLVRVLFRAHAIQLERTVEQMRAAEGKVRELNLDLSEWAASAVREVRDLSERVINTQEQERGRIARDLHDSVGQALTALHYEIELMAEHPERPDQLQEHRVRALKTCEDALAELRQRVYDLRPPELTHTADIERVLRSYAERFELRTGLPISFRCEGATVSSEELATCLLRVLQEALTNVSRHAGAGEVGVALAFSSGRVSMEVVDDGQGFRSDDPRRGSGLRGIEERCAFLGGSVEVESNPGQGTRLRVQLPVAERLR